MPAGQYTLVIEKGATLGLSLTWKDSNGTAINLTGYTARLQARTNINSSTTFLELTTVNGGITLGGVAGTTVIAMTAAATAALTASGGVYDLELVSSGSVVTRLLTGIVEIRDEVTR